jgi:hypothetical protein
MEDNNIKSEKEVLENDTIIVPNISDINLADNNVKEDVIDNIPDPVLPTIENVTTENNNLIDETPIPNLNVENSFKEDSIEEVVEVPEIKEEHTEFDAIPNISEPFLSLNEEKPFEFNDFNFSGDVINPSEPKIDDEPIKKEVKVPEFDFDKIIQNVEEVKKEEQKRGPEIFSSVYVSEKEEKVENVKETEDEEFELPTLKKVEDKKESIDVPKLNDFNLDEISGETYNIN